MRGQKCKHLFAIEFAIKWGIIKDIDKVPADDTSDKSTTNNIAATNPVLAVIEKTKSSYKDDDYTF